MKQAATRERDSHVGEQTEGCWMLGAGTGRLGVDTGEGMCYGECWESCKTDDAQTCTPNTNSHPMWVMIPRRLCTERSQQAEHSGRPQLSTAKLAERDTPCRRTLQSLQEETRMPPKPGSRPAKGKPQTCGSRFALGDFSSTAAPDHPSSLRLLLPSVLGTWLWLCCSSFVAAYNSLFIPK